MSVCTSNSCCYVVGGGVVFEFLTGHILVYISNPSLIVDQVRIRLNSKYMRAILYNLVKLDAFQAP